MKIHNNYSVSYRAFEKVQAAFSAPENGENIAHKVGRVALRALLNTGIFLLAVIEFLITAHPFMPTSLMGASAVLKDIDSKTTRKLGYALQNTYCSTGFAIESSLKGIFGIKSNYQNSWYNVPKKHLSEMHSIIKGSENEKKREVEELMTFLHISPTEATPLIQAN